MYVSHSGASYFDQPTEREILNENEFDLPDPQVLLEKCESGNYQDLVDDWLLTMQ